jgi:hypothetical protein
MVDTYILAYGSSHTAGMEMLEYDLYSSCRGTVSLHGLYDILALGNSRLSNSILNLKRIRKLDSNLSHLLSLSQKQAAQDSSPLREEVIHWQHPRPSGWRHRLVGTRLPLARMLSTSVIS